MARFAFDYARAMRIVLLLCLLFPIYLGATEVYKSIGPDGSVIYSDQASQNSTRIDIESAPGLPALPLGPKPQPAPNPVDTEEAPSTVAYQAVEILSPKQDAVVRDNAGNVTLQVKVEPVLQVANGDRLAIEVDGSHLEGRFTGDQLRLHNVDRGSHHVVVQVVDKQGAVLMSSAPRTFHMKRHSILNP